MSLLQTLEADYQKIIAWLPFVSAAVAVADPTDAAAISALANAQKDAAIVQTVVTGLQPKIAELQAAASGALTHEQLVTLVTSDVASASTDLTAMKVMSGTTDQHVQSLATVINAAVAISGLAAPATAAV